MMENDGTLRTDWTLEFLFERNIPRWIEDIEDGCDDMNYVGYSRKEMDGSELRKSWNDKVPQWGQGFSHGSFEEFPTRQRQFVREK